MNSALLSTVQRALLSNLQPTVMPCTVYGCPLYSAQLSTVRCTVIPCTPRTVIHLRRTVQHALFTTIQYAITQLLISLLVSVLCTVIPCKSHCYPLYSALLSPVHCTAPCCPLYIAILPLYRAPLYSTVRCTTIPCTASTVHCTACTVKYFVWLTVIHCLAGTEVV